MVKTFYQFFLLLILTGSSSALFAQGFTLAGGGQAQDSSYDFNYSIGNVFYNNISQGGISIIPGPQYKAGMKPSWVNPQTETTIRIYPNPTNGILEVRTEGSSEIVSTKYQITDLLGRIVFEYDNSNFSDARLDISHLPPAHYQLHIFQNNNIHSSIKIVKY